MTADRPLDDRTRAEVLGGLTFSCVESGNALALVRAAQWFNLASTLQHGMPFFLVHDVGLALAYGQGGQQVRFQPRVAWMERATQRGVLRRTGQDDTATKGYLRLLAQLGRCSLAVRMGVGGLNDSVMGALIARVLEPLRSAGRGNSGRVELPLTPLSYTEVHPPDLLTADICAAHLEVVRLAANRAADVLVAAEQVDLDSLKLMQMMGGSDAGNDPAAVLDLYRVLESPQAHDIVRFCLDLVPQVLETHRSRGSQTFAVGGYASVETKGNLDNILPSELAYDDALFEQRWRDNELLYFGREKDSKLRERLHYVLVDASAAMRGLRTTFARGLAIALCKKLILKGEAVWLRFFDSRLHEKMEVSARTLRLAQILCFRSERGHNSERVFMDLDDEVTRLSREEGKDVLVTFITHGRLAIPVEIMERLVEKCSVLGVFILPSQAVELPYLRLLAHSHVVEASALVDPQARAQAALGVLEGS